MTRGAGSQRPYAGTCGWCTPLAAGRWVDCGEPDPLVLEFDHVGTKRGQISTMVWNVGLSTLEAELAECELRCCNCHRRITALRRRSDRERASTLSFEPP